MGLFRRKPRVPDTQVTRPIRVVTREDASIVLFSHTEKELNEATDYLIINTNILGNALSGPEDDGDYYSYYAFPGEEFTDEDFYDLSKVLRNITERGLVFYVKIKVDGENITDEVLSLTEGNNND